MRESVYPYRDEAGETLFEVVRVDEPSGKKIWQRTPDGKTSLDGVRRVLYRLPELMAAVEAEETVWLVEGERCVGALARLGLHATTSVGGAGGWRPAYSTPLTGASVVILPDNDAPGIKYATEAAVSLSQVGASVRVVDLPDLPPHGDIVDWLANGGSKELLLELAEQAPFWLPPRSPTEPEPVSTRVDEDEFELEEVDWGTFFTKDRPTEEWMVEPLLPARRGVVIYSEAKAGKSLLALDVAVAVATGQRYLHSPAQPKQPVLYLDMEMTEDDLLERLLDMEVGPDTDLSRFHYYLLPNLLPLDTPEGGRALVGLVEKHGAKLVVIDTTTTSTQGDENDADTMRAYWTHTGKLLKHAGCTVLRLDHQGKDPTRGQRGSSQKIGTDDVVWQMIRKETETSEAISLTATHRRIRWCPERLDLVRLTNPTRHEFASDTWLPGTREAAKLLDQLQVPLEASKRKARTVLQTAKESMADNVLQAALRFRREHSSTRVDTPEPEPPTTDWPNLVGHETRKMREAEEAVRASGLLDGLL